MRARRDFLTQSSPFVDEFTPGALLPEGMPGPSAASVERDPILALGKGELDAVGLL